MQRLEHKDDPTWDSVMDAVSSLGNLSKFYRIPRHEMNAIMRMNAPQAAASLSRIFKLTQSQQFKERDIYIKSLPEQRVFAMLLLLGRSMKCWIETETQLPRARTRWKVATA